MEFTIKLVRLFDAISDLIVSVFAFLPPWSLALTVSACVLIVGIVVFKFIRG